MMRKTTISVLLSLCLVVMPALCGWAKPAGGPLTQNGPWLLNDLAPAGPGVYRVTGPDPYLLSPDLNLPFKDVAGIDWDIEAHGKPDALSMQMFWTTSAHGCGEGFSFRFTSSSRGGFFIPFTGYDPKAVFADDVSLVNVRLDFEQCANCMIAVRRAQWIGQATTEQSVRIPEDLIYPVTPHPIAPDFAHKGTWTLNGITTTDNGRYRISGGDPFMVSPHLNVPLSMVRGIYFRLKFPGQSGRRTMQLYWNSYSQDYDEKRSIWFLAEITHEVLHAYIPLQGIRPNDLLKTIRLDFYDAPGRSFQVLAARLVDAAGSDDLVAFTPKQIMYASGRRASASALVADILRRLGMDKGFMIAWALIVMLVGCAFRWVMTSQPQGKSRTRSPNPQ